MALTVKIIFHPCYNLGIYNFRFDLYRATNLSIFTAPKKYKNNRYYVERRLLYDISIRRLFVRRSFSFQNTLEVRKIAIFNLPYYIIFKYHYSVHTAVIGTWTINVCIIILYINKVELKPVVVRYSGFERKTNTIIMLRIFIG